VRRDDDVLAFDERARTSAEWPAKLLRTAGVDFAIRGPLEACTGDPARRMGNAHVFQAYAEQNVATLNEQGVTKIVASCPHCFNTLANEYPDFGGAYEVIHHSELLARLVREGRLTPEPGAQPITYHDSCYLGRHNDVYLAPRKVIGSLAGIDIVEMPRNGTRATCFAARAAAPAASVAARHLDDVVTPWHSDPLAGRDAAVGVPAEIAGAAVRDALSRCLAF